MKYKIETNILADIKLDVKPGKIYLVGPLSEKWVAMLLCPCGCGEGLSLNLVFNTMPKWVVDEEACTITPAIETPGPCKTRFQITQGRVKRLTQ